MLEKEKRDLQRVPLVAKELGPFERLGGGGGTTRVGSFTVTDFFKVRDDFLKEKEDNEMKTIDSTMEQIEKKMEHSKS